MSHANRGGARQKGAAQERRDTGLIELEAEKASKKMTLSQEDTAEKMERPDRAALDAAVQKNQEDINALRAKQQKLSEKTSDSPRLQREAPGAVGLAQRIHREDRCAGEAGAGDQR